MKTISLETNFKWIVERVKEQSILLSGIGDNGSIPILVIINELENLDRICISISSLVKANSSIEFFKQFMQILIDAVVSSGRLDSVSCQQICKGDFDDLNTIVDKLIKLLGKLETNIQEDQLLFIVDGFSTTYRQSEYKIIINQFNRIINAQKKIRFLFLVDRSLTDKSCLENQNLPEHVDLIDIGIQVVSPESIKLIKNILNINATDEICDLIEDLTGRMSILIKLLCDDINCVCIENSYESLTTGIVSDIARGFVKNRGNYLFESWWDNLSISEQLIILMMTFRSGKDEIKPFYVQTLQKEIMDQTGIEIDLNPIISNLQFKGFLVDSNTGYELTSGLHKSWISDMYGQGSFLLQSIEKKLLELAKSPTEYDKYVLDKYIQPISHSYLKEQSFINPVILHLSDIQFGISHAFEIIPTEKHYSLLNSLIRDMERNYRSENIPYPNKIIISGDIADWGMPNEYNRAIAFLNELISRMIKLPDYNYSLSAEDVVIVPGNHDINWKLSEIGFPEENGGKSEPNELYEYRWMFFREFFTCFYSNRKFYSIDPEEAFTIYNYSKQNGLLVVGFNSCHNVDHKNYKGYISIDTIDNAEKKIDEFIKRGDIPPYSLKCKVAVWHHDVRIGNGEHTDFLQDAMEVIKELIHHRYDVCLFGHIHEEAYMSIAPDCLTPIKLFGAGSIGVRADYRPGTPQYGKYPLTYNIVCLSLDVPPYKVKVHVRQGKPISKGVEWEPWAGWPAPNKLFFESELHTSTK
ncbi:MAG: metallophosphoesterase [Anaerolineales bacterium]|nr:metallophosphoesterase [Anaerolineales bacterium]